MYQSLSSYMVALAALVPKRGSAITTLALATASNLSAERVRLELQPLVDAGSVVYDAASDTYTTPAQPALA
ncbi:MAG: hypothetical protein LCH79_08000 [Proteobacteria bacterium]|nr:hypothetical protein [Pseudomonadota bacterium]